MQTKYKIAPYPLYRCFNDRGRKASESAIKQMGNNLQAGKVVKAAGLKLKPENKGFFRVYIA